MDYKNKYIKYKIKYNNLKLKNQLGGNKECLLNDIFDLDCFIPLTTDKSNDYIFNKRLSKKTLDYIRINIQNYYQYFTNYMTYPNLSLDELKYKNLSFDELNKKVLDNTITIPINYNKVNYDIIAEKLNENNIIEFLSENNKLITIISNQETMKNNKIIEFINNIKKSHTKLFKNILDVDIKSNLELFINTIITASKTDKELRAKYKIFEEEITNLITEIKNNINIINNINKINNRIIYNYIIMYDENIINDNSLSDLDKIKSLMINKNKKIIDNVIKNFEDNQQLNCIIVNISLKWYDIGNNSLNYVCHANSVIIYKFIKDDDNKVSYLCIRTEPHRHSDLYCRNSVRKAIRDIFSNLPNSYYLDNIINSHTGLQYDEQFNEFTKKNLTDFDNLPSNIKKLSPLQGNSGFCASWTIYTNFILLLNRSISLDKLGQYFTTFNQKIDTVSQSEKFVEEFNNCFKNKKKTLFLFNKYVKNKNCRSKSNFKNDVTQYYINLSLKVMNAKNIIQDNIIQENPKYILIKHIKLYRTIIYAVYFITRVLKITTLFDKITDKKDKRYLTKIFNKFDNFINDNDDPIKKRLLEQSKVKIKIPDDILNKDTHLCDDNLFDHEEFCLDNDISKPLPPDPMKFKCNESKLKVDNNIVLKGNNSSKKNLEYANFIYRKNIKDFLNRNINIVNLDF